MPCHDLPNAKSLGFAASTRGSSFKLSPWTKLKRWNMEWSSSYSWTIASAMFEDTKKSFQSKYGSEWIIPSRGKTNKKNPTVVENLEPSPLPSLRTSLPSDGQRRGLAWTIEVTRMRAAGNFRLFKNTDSEWLIPNPMAGQFICPFGENSFGPVWYTIYHPLPVVIMG